MQGSGLLAVFVVVTWVSSNVTQWTWARSDSDLRVSAALTEAQWQKRTVVPIS
jgi:hypothetical protein